MNKPNLFSFATSELSQDAFICWLLSWAAPEFKEVDHSLHECALALIHSFFSMHGKEAPESIHKVEVRKQDKQIDVLCIVNEMYPILIEDKTGTKNHSGQLVRYLEEIKGRNYDEMNLLPIYFKTHDQSDYTEVIKNGFQPFLRNDFLKVLNQYAGTNEILLDYRHHLQTIEDQVQSYKSLPANEWNWHSWIGFYLELQKKLQSGQWDYVANPTGGFLGFWWNFLGDENCEQYLQLEQEKLCFKIWVKNESERGSLRSNWHQILMEKSDEFGLKISKPNRFGSGQYMTVCIFSGEYRVFETGIINMTATLECIRKSDALLCSVASLSD